MCNLRVLLSAKRYENKRKTYDRTTTDLSSNMRLYKGLACVILVLSISLVDRGGQAKKQSATPVDRSSLTPEVMKHIFDLMKTYGEAERNKANEGQDKRFN